MFIISSHITPLCTHTELLYVVCIMSDRVNTILCYVLVYLLWHLPVS
uniref:Uncharacterized protein n=1 Tax=Arundo donax TaxID=35708 RepID=A0A0A8Z468_ARUDO